MTDNLPAPVPEPSGQVILYQPADGITRIEVRLEGETVWLPQRAMAELFQTTIPNINQHLKAIYDEGELPPEGTIKRCLIVQTEGNRQIRRAVDQPRKTDVSIAKNYLNQEEIESLNLIVSAYLDFAELQARNRRPMHMADWIAKLDDFLRLSERHILTHAGKISHEQAVEKAAIEFERYHQAQTVLPQPVERHFEQSLDELKQIEQQKKALPEKKPGKRKPTKKKPKQGNDQL